MTLGWRVRLLGAAISHTTGPVATMTAVRRQALRQRQPPQLLVEYLNGKRCAQASSIDSVAPTPDCGIPVRIYRPAGPTLAPALPIVIAFHGGGWVFGDLSTAEWLFSAVAAHAHALVVAVNYRLAPEHPAPAARRDAIAVTAWAAAHARQLGGEPGRIAVLGESSGATLAATVALAARDFGGPDITYQALLYPITDLTLSSPSVREMPHQPILHSADLEAYVKLYLGRGQDPTDPHLSPLLAEDHSHLPPALIITADHDPLRDDGRRYSERMQQSGVPVQHLEYRNSPHGFFSFPNICHAAQPGLTELTTTLHRALWPTEQQENQMNVHSPQRCGQKVSSGDNSVTGSIAGRSWCGPAVRSLA